MEDLYFNWWESTLRLTTPYHSQQGSGPRAYCSYPSSRPGPYTLLQQKEAGIQAETQGEKEEAGYQDESILGADTDVVEEEEDRIPICPYIHYAISRPAVGYRNKNTI